MLTAGQQAPDFEAQLDDGSTLHLGDYRGRKNVVLYFYPLAFSTGCTREACSFRDSYAAVRAFDAVVVGVSRDSAERHRDFKEAHELNFPMITDPDGKLAALYEVRTVLPFIRPRVTYVIDKAGVIRDAIRHDIAIDRHLKDTLRALEAIGA